MSSTGIGCSTARSLRPRTAPGSGTARASSRPGSPSPRRKRQEASPTQGCPCCRRPASEYQGNHALSCSIPRQSPPAGGVTEYNCMLPYRDMRAQTQCMPEDALARV